MTTKSEKLLDSVQVGNLELQLTETETHYHFKGGQFGNHSLPIDCTPIPRLLAHWRGYTETNHIKPVLTINKPSANQTEESVNDCGFASWNSPKPQVLIDLEQHAPLLSGDMATALIRLPNGLTVAVAWLGSYCNSVDVVLQNPEFEEQPAQPVVLLNRGSTPYHYMHEDDSVTCINLQCKPFLS